jgi:hypothetical protein
MDFGSSGSFVSKKQLKQRPWSLHPCKYHSSNSVVITLVLVLSRSMLYRGTAPGSTGVLPPLGTFRVNYFPDRGRSGTSLYMPIYCQERCRNIGVASITSIDICQGNANELSWHSQDDWGYVQGTNWQDAKVELRNNQLPMDTFKPPSPNWRE